MKSGEALVEVLGLIWAPALAAARLQKDLDVLSLDETIAAVERAGYAVHFADLPDNISGFAGLIRGKPAVVVNRAKPAQDQQYTLLHELGHTVLHLDPAQKSHDLVSANEGFADFQADMFAAAWIIHVSQDDQRKKEILKQNPEASLVMFGAAAMTVGAVVIALIMYLCSRFSRKQLEASK